FLFGVLLILLGLGAGVALLGPARGREEGPGGRPPEKEADGPAALPAAEKQARTDLHGDPLPADALVRLGTLRFRPLSASWLAFSPGDATLLTAGGQFLSAWDVSTG